jgi:hypothetical protein
MIITCCKLNTGKHTEDNYVNLGPVRPWKDISCMVKTVKNALLTVTISDGNLGPALP